MDISKFFIRKPVTVTIIVFAICVFGVLSYFRLPVSALPKIDYPVMTVTAFYPGATPSIMANTIAKPLEQQLIQIQGLKNIISTSTDGFTKIILTFDLNVNLDSVIPDIQSAISYAKGSMPQLPSDPQFKNVNPSDKPIMYLIVDSKSISHGKLFDISNKKIAQSLNMLQGISSVTIWSVSSAVRVKLNPQKMAEFHVTLSDVSLAIWNATDMSSGGSLSDNYRTLAIDPAGQLTTPEGYNNIIITHNDKGTVRVSDIGKAYLSTEQPNYMLKFFNKDKQKFVNPIMIAITGKEGANILNLTDRVKKMIVEMRAGLPKELNVSIIYDRSKTILSSVNEVKVTLLIAFLLVMSVIYIFIGRFKNTFIPGVIIPVSILGTFIVMYFLNYSIDNLSLMALTLAIGFIADDAIVVLENTSRHIEHGESPFVAAVRSSKEISGSIISMTCSLIIVFVPILFMGDVVGRIFSELAVTTIVIVIFSGVLSLTLTPMMCALMLNPVRRTNRNRIQRRTNYILKNTVKKYSNLLKLFLRKPYFSVILLFICIAGSILMYLIVPKNFIPNGDSGTIFGAIRAPIGVSSPQMQKYQNHIDNILNKDNNISHFFTITGIYQGADQSTGLMSLMLKNTDKRESMNRVLSELRNKFKNMPFNLGEIYLAPVPVLDINTGGQTTANGAQYSYIITGLNEHSVFKYAQKFEKKLKTKTGFKDVQSDVRLNMPQLKLEILRDKAYSLGLNVRDIENTLMSAYSKGRVAQFTENSNFYDVILEYQDKYSRNASDLSHIYLRSSTTGKMIPLSSVARWEHTVGAQSVTHYQQLPAATISFNLGSNMTVGRAVGELKDMSSQIFPASISGKFQGETEQFVSTEHVLVFLILLAAFLLYIVLAVLYESYTHPFTVLTTLPVAVVGGLTALVLFNSQLSIFAYIGLFLLLGIIVKNGIMMVDLAVQKMSKENKTPEKAIYSACLIRFRPMLMTGLTSIFGAIPLVIGFGCDASLRRPLGLIILGCLIVAQILTLFVTPGIFLYMQNIHSRYLTKSGFNK
ncbi:MAG TPA: efflux RND transporter permease subunit [Victivallales bacterium]|nr:efflux RND transporter permease subunit [Victivallales bacterium]